MVLVIRTQKLPPGVPRLPRGATHSGRSAGPASPRYRHSSRPRAAPPGTARGHRHTLGRAEEGGVTRCSVLPCRSLRDRRPRPRPPARPHLRCSWARSGPARTSHRPFRGSPRGSGTPRCPEAGPGTVRGPSTPRPGPAGTARTGCRRNPGSSRAPAGRGQGEAAQARTDVKEKRGAGGGEGIPGPQSHRTERAGRRERETIGSPPGRAVPVPRGRAGPSCCPWGLADGVHSGPLSPSPPPWGHGHRNKHGPSGLRPVSPPFPGPLLRWPCLVPALLCPWSLIWALPWAPLHSGHREGCEGSGRTWILLTHLKEQPREKEEPDW